MQDRLQAPVLIRRYGGSRVRLAIALVLTSFITLTARAGELPKCLDVTQASEQLAKLTALEQQPVVRQILAERLEPAAAEVLSLTEFEKTKSFSQGVRARSAAGDHLSLAGTKAILEKTCQLEARRIERLETQYTAALDKHFQNPNDVQLRKTAWQRVLRAWSDSGRHFNDQPRLVEWLTGALQRFAAGNLAKLPAIPQFAPLPVEPPDPVVPAIEKPRSRADRGKLVQVNLEEYEARVQGLNRSVATLVGKLAESREWSIGELSGAAADLAELGRVRRDLALYWGVFSAAERNRLLKPVKLDRALTLLSSQVSAKRQLIQTDVVDTPAELKTLDHLSKQLAELKLRQTK